MAVLAIDVGSSSVRASLYDPGGAYLPDTVAQRAHQFRRTPNGAAELDPGALLERIAAVVDECLEGRHARGAEIEAVAVCTFWHSVLGIDGRGRPTTPLLTWADRRSAAVAAKLRQRLDEEAVHRRTGCVLHSSYLPAKLAWLRERQPEVFGRTDRWISAGELLELALFGEARVGTSMASGTGLFDQNGCRWDREVLEAVGVSSERLSPVADDPASGLREPWRSRWPQLAAVPWFPAAGDGACSNVGAGCVTADRLALMVGTSGAMRMVWRADHVEVPGGLWCYRADARRFVLGGALSDGGNLVAWLRSTLRLPEPAEAERQLEAMAPDAHGLTFLPLLAGERGPGWSDEAKGAVNGLSMATRPIEVLRAALEGVALRLGLIAGIIDAALPRERHVVATGGGLLHSPAWTQIMADVLGKRVVASSIEEASSRGAALLALESLGVIERLEEVKAPLGRSFEPDPDRHQLYAGALRRQRRLYETLVEGG